MYLDAIRYPAGHVRCTSTFACSGLRLPCIEHLQIVLDSPQLMHSHELACKSNSHKARTDFAARNTSGSCSACFWFTRLRIYTVVFGHALTSESNRVESREPVPATSRAVFTPRVRRRGICAQVHALTPYEDPAACACALTRAFVRVQVRAAYVNGLRFDSGGYRIGRRYYP